jgi:hypothetical protein
MGTPARAHGIGTLVHIRVKAHEEYDPIQEPTDCRVEYGNYYVNQTSL